MFLLNSVTIFHSCHFSGFSIDIVVSCVFQSWSFFIIATCAISPIPPIPPMAPLSPCSWDMGIVSFGSSFVMIDHVEVSLRRRRVRFALLKTSPGGQAPNSCN